jgi:hypothetical protein
MFCFAMIGVPSYTHRGGLDVIGQPAGWGKEQAEWYTEHHYHQPSDEYSPAWDLEGAMEDLRLVFDVAHTVANQATRPAWNEGEEFAELNRQGEF